MMNRRRLGSKDIALDANSLRVLWKGDTGGTNYPLFVQPVSVLDISTSTFYPIEWYGAKLVNGGDYEAYGFFMTPAAASITITPVLNVTADGTARNIRCKTSRLSAVDDAQAAASTTGFATVAIPSGTNNFIYFHAIAQTLTWSASASEFVQLSFYRDAGVAADTVEADIYLMGWKLDYA